MTKVTTMKVCAVAALTGTSVAAIGAVVYSSPAAALFAIALGLTASSAGCAVDTLSLRGPPEMCGEESPQERLEAERAVYLPEALREVDALLPWTEPVAATVSTPEQRLIATGQQGQYPIELAPVRECSCQPRCGKAIPNQYGSLRVWCCSSECVRHFRKEWGLS